MWATLGVLVLLLVLAALAVRKLIKDKRRGICTGCPSANACAGRCAGSARNSADDA